MSLFRKHLSTSSLKALLMLVFLSCSFMLSAQDDMLLIAKTSSDQAVVGQPVVYTITLLTENPNIAGVRPASTSDYGDCDMRLNISPQNARYVGERMHNKKPYHAIIVEQMVLYPSSSGKLKIKGREFEVSYQENDIVYDPFWGKINRGQMTSKKINTPDKNVKVKAFPSTTPEHFSGAIGDFTFDAYLPKGSVVKGKTNQIVYVVSGIGSLEDVRAPEVNRFFPPELEVKYVGPEDTAKVENGNLTSTVEFVVTFVPSATGTYTIEPVEFVFFNPATSKFVTVKSPKIDIEVHPDKHSHDWSSPAHV